MYTYPLNGTVKYYTCPHNHYPIIVCFTSYFVFSKAWGSILPTVIVEMRVAPFSFRIGIWDLFVHRGQKSYTPTAFGKLWTTPGVRCMKHASS